MKPRTQTVHVTCECRSDNHIFKFTLEKWPDQEPSATVEMSVHLSHYLPFPKRLWRAFKYVVGAKSADTDWDCTLLRKEDAESILRLLNEYLAEVEESPVS